MKLNPATLALLVGMALIPTPVNGRGERGNAGSGGSRDAAPKRSPMTGSKIERPTSRPEPRPTPRPESRPTARPEVRPATRPDDKPTARPEVRPAARPETRPAPRPELRPDTRPSTRPAERPSVQRPSIQMPESRPANLPDRAPGFTRPDQRPSIERPANTRPSTLPGMVTYPSRPDKRPDISRDKINIGDRNRVDIGNVNVNRVNVDLKRPSNFSSSNRKWDNQNWGGNRGVWGNTVNVKINNNFRYNNNFSYRPNYWGARPWWGASQVHYWHHGHWSYGWNSSYYRRHWWYSDNDFASGFMWGIAVWSLGNLVYDMGYHSYRNPYPAPPVQNTYITYAQPVSVAAAANPPGDEQATELAETQSAAALELAIAAFKLGDYVSASKSVDEAIAHTPGDVTLHEFRSLVFFALGKYSDAAGVLNPVLASGPGWGWDTMIGFYQATDTYSEQLRKLEDYAKKSPDKADARFLLGYHYMVCGYMDKANAEFTATVGLQPADSISRQLRDLTAASIPDATEPSEPAPERPDPVNPDQLVGTWVCDRGEDGKVTFTMTESGDYTWAFMNAGQSSDLAGTYGLNEMGLLVLSSDDSQMVCAVEIKPNGGMQFILVGAPDGDPGLEFVKN
jgi:tetratricopeptide (TPR) repeat protein